MTNTKTLTEDVNWTNIKNIFSVCDRHIHCLFIQKLMSKAVFADAVVAVKRAILFSCFATAWGSI